ncbi:CREB/ATF bZIP transcription factor isoform X4 [Gadus morhua]|uniref:CREB/ATF bZIP transcription factor isoform X4 n=1 Tax=Gadus morhua TaxID=8049 RepID=UPI0011B428B9|nr:CREB/ATF bZIP transcription factor isoform X4 [Gadus morhua]
MITRRRGSIKRHEVQSPEFEVTDAVETVDDLPCLHEEDDGTGLELDELFGIDDLKWTGDNDTTSSLFDVGLNDWGVYNMKDDDSMFEASTSPSPERTPFEARSKKSENRAGSMVNKNAIAARMNRLKKKEYVNDLEKKVGLLSTKNHKLEQDNCGLNKRVEELEDETRQPT